MIERIKPLFIPMLIHMTNIITIARSNPVLIAISKITDLSNLSDDTQKVPRNLFR